MPKGLVTRPYHLSILHTELRLPVKCFSRYMAGGVAVVNSIRVKPSGQESENVLWESVAAMLIRHSRYVIMDADGFSEGCGLAWEMERADRNYRVVLVFCRRADYTPLLKHIRKVAPGALLIPEDFHDIEHLKKCSRLKHSRFHIIQYDTVEELRSRAFAVLDAFYRYDLTDWWKVYHRDDSPVVTTFRSAVWHFLFSSASFANTVNVFQSTWLRMAHWREDDGRQP
jgi:hypothetical protein